MTMKTGSRREVIAKLKLPMPINEGLRQVTDGLEKLYGKCYCGNWPETHEDGWWIIWREAVDQ